MTESAASTTPAPPATASFWEDLIDIFISPVAVFARRARASAWAPFLCVVIATAIITYATFPSVQPAFEGDFTRALPKLMQQQPKLTPELADKMMGYQAVGVRYFAGPLTGLIVLVDALMVWLLGKLFGAAEGFGAAILIASYAFFPRVLSGVISGAEALVMDPTKLRSVSMLTLSPARFLDPDTANPFTIAVLSRLDLTIIWQTVLLATGLAVIGRVSRGKAAVFAVVIWLAGSLYLLRAAYLAS